MYLIMLDLELRDKNVVWQKMGIFNDGQVFGYSMKPPISFQPTFQTHCCTNTLNKIGRRSGALDNHVVATILTSLKQYRNEFFATGLEKKLQCWARYWASSSKIDDNRCPEFRESNSDGLFQLSIQTSNNSSLRWEKVRTLCSWTVQLFDW